MKITGVKVYRVAPKSNYVKVETDEGICGWGEPVVEGRSRATAVAVKELGEQLIGMDPENIEDLFNVMYRGNFYQGGPVLCSAPCMRCSGVHIRLRLPSIPCGCTCRLP